MNSRTLYPLVVLQIVVCLPPTQAEEYRLAANDHQRETLFSSQVWRSPAIVNDASLNDVTAVGSQCWAVGERGVVVRSSDSGLTWTAGVLPFDCELNSVCFLTNRIGYVAGLRLDPYTRSEAGVLLTTSDGGDTWTDMTPDAHLPGLRTVRFFGPDQGVLITTPANGKGGVLLTTRDGGQSWQEAASEANRQDWVNATFLRPDEGIIVGSRLTYGLVNGGRLRPLADPRHTLQTVTAVSLSDDGRAWMVGDGGFVRRSTNRGVTWKPPAGEFQQELRDIFRFTSVVHDGNRVCLAGSPGSSVLYSDDAGTSWTIVPCSQNGSIRRLTRVGKQTILAVGSWGTITRSDDFGKSWTSIRNGNYRSALLYVVTDPHAASPLMLGTVSGARGYRVSVLQPSQHLNQPPRTDRWRAALCDLGASTFEADWRFVRTRKRHAMSQTALLDSWDASSEGRMRELLPLRLAVQIRTCQPDVICIESADTNDAAAAIWQAAIEPARLIAAGDDPRSDSLDSAGLPRWTVKRVVRRVHGRTTPLEFHADSVLPELRTTAGTIADGWYLKSAPGKNRTADSYALPPNDQSPVPRDMFQGIKLAPGSDARRSLPTIGPELETLQKVAAEAQALKTTIAAEVHRKPLSDGLIAHTRTIGKDLPPALATGQLQHMLQLFRDSDNLESHIAVLRELARRFPDSPEAAQAANELHLLYSSAEILMVRTAWQQKKSNRLKNSALSIVDATSASGVEIRPASSTSLDKMRPSLGAAAAALNRQWNHHAESALSALRQLAPTAANTARQQLIQAARSRRLEQFGKERTLLAAAAAADDPHRLLAQNEMQASFSAVEPVLQTFNLPESRQRPALDGLLSDLCWQQAAELRLIDDQPGNRVPDSLIMFSWDEEFLYFAGRLPQVGNVAPGEEQLDRDHDEADTSIDHIELSLDVDRDYSSTWNFVIDSSGRTSDRCWQLSRWNPDWFIATQRDKTGWRFEAAIPVQELQPQLLTAGDKWSVGIRRVVPGYADQQVSGGEVARELETRYSLIRFIVNRRAE